MSAAEALARATAAAADDVTAAPDAVVDETAEAETAPAGSAPREGEDPPAQPAASGGETAPAAEDTPAQPDPPSATEAAAVEPATAETEAAESEAAETEAAETGATETGAAESETPKREAVEPATAETGAAESETPEPEAVESKAAAPEAEEPGPAEPDKAEKPAESGGAQPESEVAAKPPAKRGKQAAAAPELPDRPELRPVREALANRTPLEGRVIGWNNGGFHLALGELAAFCPRSEMEVGEIADPESYLDKTFEFRVLRLQGKKRRIVVSRAAHLRKEQTRQRSELRKKLKPGTVLTGTVASLKEFGAFVDLGGAQGLVHVSEISHRRVAHPGDVLSEGQEVQVKVLKLEQGGRRISLSIRALEPDPWKDLIERFPQGAVVKGTVETANQIGAFIELEPGVTGLLPARAMSIPRETTPARAYPPGKEVSVQIVTVDSRRQRISLALEGSGLEGSRHDYKEFQRQNRKAADGDGFNALASAFRRLQSDGD